jgi:hypothetical protein
MKVYDGSTWLNAYASLSGALLATNNLSDLNNTATARTNLGVAIGTNVQAYDADLAAIAALAPTADNFIVGNGTTWILETPAQARTSLGLGTIATQTAPAGTVVGTSDTQTLTNKTIALGSNTVSGTLAQFNTAVTDADLVSLAGTETLTNKTLTSPTLTTPALGTPASGVVTNLTGTASININGTVGATTPAAGTFTSLSDSGNLTFTGTGNRITGDFSNGTISNGVVVQTSTTNSATSLAVAPNGSSAISGFFAVSGLTADESLAQFRMVGGSDMRLNSTRTGTGTYLPLTMYTGGSERLRIDTSGNVGIGTSSPAVKTEISGTAAASNLALRITNTATDGYSTLQMGDGNAGIYRNGSAQSGYAGASSLNLITVGAHNIGFSTGNTLRAVIDSSGNVGIGTSSPATKLQVSGTTRLDGNVESNAAQYIYSWAGGSTGQVRSGVYLDGTNQVLQLLTGTNERMRIDSSGNVGIGTSSPAARLDVRTTSSTQATFTRTGQTAVCTLFQSASDSYLSATNSGASLILATQDTERGRFDSSGNFLFNSGYGSVATAYGCRAWVNFNGTGTVAIRGSGNVSSITDNGTGDYTINFTTAMPDANYSLAGNYSWVNGVSAGGGLTIRNETGRIPTTTTCRLDCTGQNGTSYDRDYVFASFFR